MLPPRGAEARQNVGSVEGDVVSSVIDNLITEGKAEHMIVVMPNGSPSKQAASGKTCKISAIRPWAAMLCSTSKTRVMYGVIGDNICCCSCHGCLNNEYYI